MRAGTGMAAVLRMANEKRAYTLSDLGTFLAQRDRLDLLLSNPYSVMIVSLRQYQSVNHAGARRFAEYLLSPAVQRVIGEFGVERFGKPLFVPGPAPVPKP